ncbi:MAG: hypothetical protein AAGI10_12925 [Pseudomonadota bacterium]
MDRRKWRIVFVITLLIGGGFWAAPWIENTRCQAPWLNPAAGLLVALPVLYGFGFLVEALWDGRMARKDVAAAELYRARADTLRDVAGKVPVPLFALLIAGVFVQVLFGAAELRIGHNCAPPEAVAPIVGVEETPPKALQETSN